MTNAAALDPNAPEYPSEDVLRISQAMRRIRRMIGKRPAGRVALAKIAPGLDLQHIDILDVTKTIAASPEMTVGAIAAAINLDPSRGSRLVSEMVEWGLLRRDVSQTDARKSIVIVTDLGLNLLNEVQAVKLAIINEILADWPDEEIASFANQFYRFIDRFEAFGHLETL